MKINIHEIEATRKVCLSYYENLNRESPGRLKEFDYYFNNHLSSWVGFKKALVEDALKS